MINQEAALDHLDDVIYGVGVDSTNRIDAIMDAVAQYDNQMFWPIVNRYWSSCDLTWHAQEELRRLLLAHGRGVDHLDDAATQFYESLPDTVTIYRGCNLDRIDGLSWTTDEEVAVGFAKGHRSNRVPFPVVASTTVQKSEIYSVSDNREESEVLVILGSKSRDRMKLTKPTALRVLGDQSLKSDRWSRRERRMVVISAAA
ncbi:MAG: hypothetical protein ABGZ53_09880, partial [Fuerstiella sp.]